VRDLDKASSPAGIAWSGHEPWPQGANLGRIPVIGVVFDAGCRRLRPSVVPAAAVALLESAPLHRGHSRLFAVAENKMLAFIKRFLLHYGIYRRYPLGRFPALRNAWRAAQP